MRHSLLLVLTAWLALPAWAGPPVAPTDPLPPDVERTKFKLPPGFEIQLVAAEPDIQKPMNLAFDARGRLWVTHSVEYPFAAPNDRPARDGLTILDGIGPDGKATKVTRFADGLNIPIGVLPLGAGDEAIVWSIPNLWKLRDTDGDGRADEREVLYGPFDIADTHGNQNALRMGLDGWVYACHGFRNDSKIKLRGQGDVVLNLQSGNTYRFKPDGSSIEQMSWGQVNPFGMCVDQRGDWFTADCHSKPLTMLLRGGYYESFGKPHDGLGYAPPVTGHDHGSTGIAGVAWYGATQFPAEYHGSLFVGNVITNIVHRDVPQWRGSTPWVAAPETFLECEDFWFHPVDLQIGPDGALYIADFYNCIIGHYEVDLQHPRRDRERGRIWRVVWRGLPDGPAATIPPLPDFTRHNPGQLLNDLNAPNWTARQLAFAWWMSQTGAAAVDQALRGQEQLNLTSHQQVLAYWAAERAGTYDPTDPFPPPPHDQVASVQRLRAVAELPKWHQATTHWVRGQLQVDDPFVRRAAAQALALHPAVDNVKPLLAAWRAASDDDVQLIHSIRIALRNQLRDTSPFGKLDESQWDADDRQRIVEIALAVPTDAAAAFALRHAGQDALNPDVIARGLANMVRYGNEARLEEATLLLTRRFAGEATLTLPTLRGVVEGLRQRGERVPADSPLGRWAATEARRWLDPQQTPQPAWSAVPLDAAAGRTAPSPWGLRKRQCADGQEALFFDSIVGGEALTGVLRSAPFVVPRQLTFWMCGHNGLPDQNPTPVNHLRLRLVDGGEVIAREVPPRNDVARKYEWNLQRWAGQRAYLEVVDANTENAYAWLAVSRFEPLVVAAPAEGWDGPSAGQELAIALVDRVRLDGFTPRLRQLAADNSATSGVRIAALDAYWKNTPAEATTLAVEFVASNDQPPALRVKAADLLATSKDDSARTALGGAIATAPSGLQQVLAVSLASTPRGAEALFQAVAAGKASARLLQERVVVERLKTSVPERLEERLAELTRHLPPADQRLRQLIAQRLAGFAASQPALETGAAVFKKNCATCHKLKGEGPMIGPQLDGIGQRGPERLLEDLLDPNRNVDAAFRTTTITTGGGAVITGLKLREEGQQWILADNQGKELRVAANDIEESRVSPLSLMPANLVEMLPESDLYSLLAYLLEQRNKN